MLDGVKISAVSEDVIFLCCSVVGGTLPLVQGDPSIFLLEINLVAVSRNTGHISSGYTANTQPATYWCSCNLYTANTQPATYLKMLPEHWHWLPYASNTVNAIFKIPISVWKFILRYYVYINITYILRRFLLSAIKDKFCLFRNNITVPCHLPS